MKFNRNNTPPKGFDFSANPDADPFRRLPVEGSLSADARTTLALLRVEDRRIQARRLAHLSALSPASLARAIRELSTGGFLVVRGAGETALLALVPAAKITTRAAA